MLGWTGPGVHTEPVEQRPSGWYPRGFVDEAEIYATGAECVAVGSAVQLSKCSGIWYLRLAWKHMSKALSWLLDGLERLLGVYHWRIYLVSPRRMVDCSSVSGTVGPWKDLVKLSM